MILLFCLDEEPLIIVKRLSVTPPNYHIDWDTLLEKYPNPNA